jgi:hypothetical protein
LSKKRKADGVASPGEGNKVGEIYPSKKRKANDAPRSGERNEIGNTYSSKKRKANDFSSPGVRNEVGGIHSSKKRKTDDASISSVRKKTKAKWGSLSQPLPDIDMMKRKAIGIEVSIGEEPSKQRNTQPAVIVTS